MSEVSVLGILFCRTVVTQRQGKVLFPVADRAVDDVSLLTDPEASWKRHANRMTAASFYEHDVGKYQTVEEFCERVILGGQDVFRADRVLKAVFGNRRPVFFPETDVWKRTGADDPWPVLLHECMVLIEEVHTVRFVQPAVRIRESIDLTFQIAADVLQIKNRVGRQGTSDYFCGRLICLCRKKSRDRIFNKGL